jgi:hypothetical protein
LEWGSPERIALAKEQARRDGGKLPPSLANRPTLKGFLQQYYDAFQVLNGSRQWTMGGPSAIPFSEIAAYLSINNITNAVEREDYIMFVQALDNAYLEYNHKKGKK